MRKQRENEEQSTRDSHTKRYLSLNDDDERKKTAIPYPLDDVFNFVAGGSDTTAYTTACAFYHILSSPTVCKNLVAELDEHSSIIRDELDYNKIQNLPYLVSAQSVFCSGSLSARCTYFLTVSRRTP